MSSDPFADLASSSEAFATEFREFMNRNPRPAPGSPAEQEAQAEPFAGDWSDHPSSDIFATTYLAATSCTDHLLGLADVLSSRNALFAAYTLTRGAVEAAALGCYITDQDIDARERVRRTMNYRLEAMCERVWLFKDIHGDYAAEKLAETRQRISDFARGAREHNFIFHEMNGKGRTAHVGPEQPKAMTLISLAVDKEHARARADLPAAAERDRSLRCPRSGTHADTCVPEHGSSWRSPSGGQHRPSNARGGTGRRTAHRAQPRERHRVVHRLRHERPPRIREPDAQDLVAHRPDAVGDSMTRPIPPAVDLAKFAQAAPFNARDALANARACRFSPRMGRRQALSRPWSPREAPSVHRYKPLTSPFRPSIPHRQTAAGPRSGSSADPSSAA